METSLAIETPEGIEKTLLSASSIDFHDSANGRKPMANPIEEESDLFDILCDLADEHESFISTPSKASSSNIDDNKAVGSQNSIASRITVTTPLLDIISSSDSVEDLPFDDDSVLGTQHSRTSPDAVSNTGVKNDPSSDSDEDRETLEMSQIFEESEHVDEFFQRKYLLLI